MSAQVPDLMMQYRLTLPFPPSVNGYWRHPTRGKLAGRHLISEKGRHYRTSAMAACHRQKAFGLEIEGRLAIEIVLYPPDRRRRDIDNYQKGIFDSLVHARVILDDEQFDKMCVRRGTPANGKMGTREGWVEIFITTLIPVEIVR